MSEKDGVVPFLLRVKNGAKRRNLQGVSKNWRQFIFMGQCLCLTLIVASIIANWRMALPVHILTAVVANVSFVSYPRFERHTAAFTITVIIFYCTTSAFILLRTIG